MNEPTTLCGETIDSKRSLLASLWSFVTLLTAISFLTAFIFAIADDGNNGNYYYNNNKGNYNNYYGAGEGASEDEQQDQSSALLAVTSRALAFSATWTGVLAALMSVFGTVILGWQSPTGQYYTCCSASVHKTTPLGLGSFIGSLLMLANLTLICAVLFGDFQIVDRDSRDGEDWGGAGGDEEAYWGQSRETRSSVAFAYLCLFLTVLYAGFAALTYVFADGVIDEYDIDERDELQGVSGIGQRNTFSVAYEGGYIGGLHTPAGPTGFVSSSVKATEATIT